MGLKTFGEKILREITFLAQKYLWVPGKHWVQKVLGKKMCGKKIVLKVSLILKSKNEQNWQNLENLENSFINAI